MEERREKLGNPGEDRRNAPSAVTLAYSLKGIFFFYMLIFFKCTLLVTSFYNIMVKYIFDSYYSPAFIHWFIMNIRHPLILC